MAQVRDRRRRKKPTRLKRFVRGVQITDAFVSLLAMGVTLLVNARAARRGLASRAQDASAGAVVGLGIAIPLTRRY